MTTDEHARRVDQIQALSRGFELLMLGSLIAILFGGMLFMGVVAASKYIYLNPELAGPLGPEGLVKLLIVGAAINWLGIVCLLLRGGYRRIVEIYPEADNGE